MASQAALIEQAILSVPGGRQEDLAAAMGVAQQTVSKLLRGEVPVSPEQAIAIHRATRGAVPGSALRPDLWCRPEHVPVQESAESQLKRRAKTTRRTRRGWRHDSRANSDVRPDPGSEPRPDPDGGGTSSPARKPHTRARTARLG